MRFVIFIIIFQILLLTSCQGNDLDTDTKFRVDVLYEHTLQMKRLSTSTMLEKINLDSGLLVSSDKISHIEKIAILEKSFGIDNSGNYNDRINVLETRMEKMMPEWYELQQLT